MRGIRNLANRLNSNFDKTLDELRDEGFIVCEYGDRLSGVLCEDSGTCILKKSEINKYQAFLLTMNKA